MYVIAHISFLKREDSDWFSDASQIDASQQIDRRFGQLDLNRGYAFFRCMILDGYMDG